MENATDQNFIEWHQNQKGSSDEMMKILKKRDFNVAGELSLDELNELGRLLSVGLGSTVLGIRGKYSMFEANDIKVFNGKLRDMLFSSGDLAQRVDSFLDMKYVGVQTVSQFLCKFDYKNYPFFAHYMLAVFDNLSIDEHQRMEARKQAEQEFNLEVNIRHNRTFEYFEYFVILREIRNELRLEDYLQTQNLLWRFSELRGELEPYTTPVVLSLQQLSEKTYLPVEFLKGLESLLTEKKQVILYGPPGTGKTFIAEEMALYFAGSRERVVKVQFHPSYSYEDFVEGLKPKLTEGKLTYDVVPGAFKKFCRDAISSPERHVFIIDEINRGNIAKVFGELIYCLEYRDREVTLPNSEEMFKIPSNLYIIATMNSADRSIALVDYALRRRFYFEELRPDASILSKYLSDNKCVINANALVAFFNKINEKVERKLGKEYTIGHSYFMIENMDKDKVNRVWKYAVYPLLEEYFFHNKSELEEFEKDFAEFLSSI
jgi:hypothetical protein